MKDKLKRLKAHQSTLYYLSKLTSTKDRKKFIKHLLTTNQIQTICEIVHNILHGKFPIKSKIKQKLFKYKQALRLLKCPKISIEKKRKILIQKGGFLPILLGSVVSSLLNHFLLNRERK